MITDCTEAEYFFRGEFVLVLAGIDVDMAKGESADDQAPLPGLYLYLHEASEPIAGLLSENPDWLDKLYAHPLSDILTIFDRNAYKAVAPGCSGAYGFKTAEVHQEALKRKIERK